MERRENTRCPRFAIYVLVPLVEYIASSMFKNRERDRFYKQARDGEWGKSYNPSLRHGI